MSDIGDWNEITIKAPGWKATPDEIANFLRAVFPEDAILPHQQRIAEAGLREAVITLRYTFGNSVKKRGDIPQHMVDLVSGLLDMIDPDNKEYDGFFPSKLVCPHGDTSTAPAYRQMLPVMEPCPGYPRCKAGADIRETRR